MLLSCKRFVLAFLLLLSFAAVAAAAPKEGDPFPNLSLSGSISDADAAYLGISGVKAPVALSRLKGEVFLVEMFSMYCPYCQREAPLLAEMFKDLQASPQKDRFKMIGVGVNNSDAEVDIFRKKYPSPFPLFSDPDGAILEQVGVTATPSFFVVKADGKGGFKVVKTHIGHIENRSAFLQEAFTAAGLK